MFDWAHCYVSDGIADEEFGRFMRAMHRGNTQHKENHTCTYQNLFEFLLHMFTKQAMKRWIETGKKNCSAKGLLTLAPVIRRFLVQVVEPQGKMLLYVHFYSYI